MHIVTSQVQEPKYNLEFELTQSEAVEILGQFDTMYKMLPSGCCPSSVELFREAIRAVLLPWPPKVFEGDDTPDEWIEG